MQTPVVAVLNIEKVKAFMTEKMPHTAGVPQRVPQNTILSWKSKVTSVRDSYHQRSFPSLSIMNHHLIFTSLRPTIFLTTQKSMALKSITKMYTRIGGNTIGKNKYLHNLLANRCNSLHSNSATLEEEVEQPQILIARLVILFLSVHL